MPDIDTKGGDGSEALSPDHAAELQRVKDQAAQDEADAEKNAEIARLQSHPHTQLTALIKDLQSPRMDLHDRMHALHGGIVRLAQIVLSHTPPPDNPNVMEKS